MAVVFGVVALAVLGAILMIAGHDPAAALAALWRGSFGSRDAVLSATLVRATPLLLVGVGMVIALRSGVINVGGDGQLLAGATAAAAIAYWAPPAAGLGLTGTALGAGAIAGAAWAWIPAWLRERFGTLEVVSTIMMNFIAGFAVSYLVRGPLQEPGDLYPQSPPVPAAMRLPILVEGSLLHAGLLLALVTAACAWLVLEKRASGFRLRVTGSNARAAEVAGRIDVGAVQRTAFLASGSLAGVAGAVEVSGVTFALYENLSPGYGYSAIAVALLARLGPLHAVWSAILLGALSAGASAMQREAGIPAGASVMVEAILILTVLGSQSLGLRAARAWTR